MRRKRDLTWTPELAYTVGLITTDGCLSSDGRHVAFTSKDIDLMRTFSSLLRLQNKIGLTRNRISCAYRIQFSHVQLYTWLLEIGLTPHKSKTLGTIKVPDEFFVDFLRGHLDGDGSITTYTDRYNTSKNPAYVYERLSMRFISASKLHAEWIHQKIRENLGVTGRLHSTKQNPKTGNIMHIVKFGKKDSLNLLGKIYYSENLPSLDRKRIKALSLLRTRSVVDTH